MANDVDAGIRRPPSDDPDLDPVDQCVRDGDDGAETDSADDNGGRETERISIYFRESTAKRPRMYAADKGRPMSRIVDEFVADELEGWTPEF